ncbi:MAG: M3 family metallopeptidase, partial [Thermotogota bacterium]
FEEAKEIVIDTYYQFNERAGEIVESFFNEKRIHSDVLPGKDGGAFCSYYIPNGKPFVLLNHNNSINDVLTMAHELGHGLHGTLSAKQSMLNYHTPLPMAEVASVFGEFLVFDRLLPTLRPKEKQLFLASTIEGNFATTFRQNMFARFELQSHDLISKAGFASWDDLSQLYEKELKIMFSESVKITQEYQWEWSTIPHIFNVPFYVYAYNFANLLVIALYEKYKEEGDNMIPHYFQLLESGGNDRPDRLLEKLGIDLTDQSFWQKGFDYIGKLIDELE